MALLLTLLQKPAAAPGDSSVGRPCVVQVDSIGGNYREVTVATREKNYFAGGGVLAHCQGTGSVLSADSVAYYSGVGRFDMIGQRNPVHIRDTSITLDARTASYFLRQERLEAHKDVVAVNRTSGTVLRGPNLTYYRAARGVRDTLEMYATSRPTISYRAGADSAEPYLIVADRVRFKGNDRVWGGGKVTIDRSDFAARADSMQLDRAAGFGLLVGKPRVEGKGERAYALVGTRIELGLRDRELHRVKALGEGVAMGADWRLTADTIDLAIEGGKLQQAFAWSGARGRLARGGEGGEDGGGAAHGESEASEGRERREGSGGRGKSGGSRADTAQARAISTLHTIQADSLAVDAPDEVLTEVRAFGRALSTSKKDSSATATVDWITGDTLTAHWVQDPDSTRATDGKAKSMLRHIGAGGAARSLTHLYDGRDSTGGPSLSYLRAPRIDIVLKGDRVDRVTATGRADGVQLEPLPPKPPADSTKADPVKKPDSR